MDIKTITTRKAVLDKIVDMPGETSVIENVVLFDENSMDTGVGSLFGTVSVLHVAIHERYAEKPDRTVVKVRFELVRYVMVARPDIRGLGYIDLEHSDGANTYVQMHDTGELAAIMLSDEEFEHIAAGMNLAKGLSLA